MKNIIKTITTIPAFIVFTLFSSCKYEEATNTNLLYLLAAINMQPEKSFTVTLNENNGSSNHAVEEQIFTSKSCTLKSAKNLGFSKENHVFKGWSLSPSSTEIAHTDAETFMPETDISLYAIWQEASELKSVSQIRDIFAKLVNTEPDYSDYVYFIKAFKSADTAPASPEFFLDQNNTIPLFYDKDTSTIYYYSAGAKLKLPANSSRFFENMYYLEYIETKDFDTSSVTDMSCMFADCYLETLDLSNFKTENVTNMSSMFERCSSLKTIDLKSFDSSNVTDMSSMFRDCNNLKTLDLSNFNTENITNMSSMFQCCDNLETLDLSSFDTSNVTNMRSMFRSCQNFKTLDLKNFDTSNVTDMDSLFAGCVNLKTLNLKKFNTKNVTTMENMFENCHSITELDLRDFDTSSVNNMFRMFFGCNNLSKLDLSSFDTSSVNDMCDMFRDCLNLKEINLQNFNTSNIKDFSGMFYYCTNLSELDLSSFDTSNVKSMCGMFSNCEKLSEIDLNTFDFSNLKWTIEMFNDCKNLHKIYTSSNASCTQISQKNGDGYNMFHGCVSLEGGSGTKYSENNTDSSYAKVDGGTSSPGYFSVKE